MTNDKNVAIIVVTEAGLSLGREIRERLVRSDLFVPATLGVSEDNSVNIYTCSLKDLVAEIFFTHRVLIFIMACGIVVRMIAPHLKSKYTDPAVVVVDEEGIFSISLLSGHEGGANNWAKKVASLIESRPVITTASETALKPLVVVGLGFHRGISKEELEEAIFECLKETNLSLRNVRNLATIESRKDEKGLVEFSQEYGIPVETFTLDQLKEVPLFSEPSKYVLNALGVGGICEPAACLSAQNKKPIIKKRKWKRKNVTIAIAEVNSS